MLIIGFKIPAAINPGLDNWHCLQVNLHYGFQEIFKRESIDFKILS